MPTSDKSERRRTRIQRAIDETQVKLNNLNRDDYPREQDFRRVQTMWQHKIAGLKKLLEAAECHNS